LSSLLSFIPIERKLNLSFDYQPWKNREDPIDPLTVLTAAGKKSLEKIKNFINKQQIYDFMSNCEVSM
jgi:hypothetical protein